MKLGKLLTEILDMRALTTSMTNLEKDVSVVKSGFGDIQQMQKDSEEAKILRKTNADLTKRIQELEGNANINAKNKRAEAMKTASAQTATTPTIAGKAVTGAAATSTMPATAVRR
jgi:regulator of replication initiation timing